MRVNKRSQQAVYQLKGNIFKKCHIDIIQSDQIKLCKTTKQTEKYIYFKTALHSYTLLITENTDYFHSCDINKINM